MIYPYKSRCVLLLLLFLCGVRTIMGENWPYFNIYVCLARYAYRCHLLLLILLIHMCTLVNIKAYCLYRWLFVLRFSYHCWSLLPLLFFFFLVIFPINFDVDKWQIRLASKATYSIDLKIENECIIGVIVRWSWHMLEPSGQKRFAIIYPNAKTTIMWWAFTHLCL